MGVAEFLCRGNKALKVVGIIVGINILFGLLYWLFLSVAGDEWNTGSSNEDLGTSFLNGMYTSTIITTSVGFGDFYPKNWWGKLVVLIHGLSVYGLILYAGFLDCP
jgi:hypothetical protein